MRQKVFWKKGVVPVLSMALCAGLAAGCAQSNPGNGSSAAPSESAESSQASEEQSEQAAEQATEAPAAPEKVDAVPMDSVVTETVEVDPQNPLATELNGLYEVELRLEEEGDVLGTALHYVPESIGYRQPAVAVCVPSDTAADVFMESSGWKAVADENGMSLILLSAPDGQWSYDDLDYLEAGFAYMDDWEFLQMQDAAFYMAGYEDAADAAMAFELQNAELFAGFAAFGVDDFDTALLDEAKKTPSKAEGVMKSEVAVPMWIGADEKTDAVSDLVEYWKNANSCGDEAYGNAYASEIYAPVDYLAKTNEITYTEGQKLFVTIGQDNVETAEFTSYLYNDFLKRTRRQDSGDINALRSFATNEEKGMERVTLEAEGVTREFYVYVPDAVSAGSKASAPLVFAFHGGGGSGEEFPARSGWDKVAEERGFVCVFPTGHRSNEKFKASTTWGAEDLPFFEAMRDYMLEHYDVIDPSRIYVSGQSMGCIMSCTIAVTHPEWIAACAATSARLMPEEVENANYDLLMPFMWSVGEKDQYFVEGGKDYGLIPVCIGQWRSRYGITADESGTYTYQNGNFHGYDFKNADGVTLIREQLVTGKIHAMIPDEVYTLYDFLSCYSRDEQGISYYMGQEISPECK